MERDLHVRDRVGVQDFVLLEDYKSEAAFIENLQKRTKEDLIYVSGLTNSYLMSGQYEVRINSNFKILTPNRADVYRFCISLGQSI